MIYFNASGVGHRIPGGINPVASLHALTTISSANCILCSDQ